MENDNRTCSSPLKEHRPRYHEVDTHHIKPLSWGGQSVQFNLVDLCVQCHHNVHSLIDEFVRCNGEPPPSVMKMYTMFEQGLALEAWARRPPHPTITSRHWSAHAEAIAATDLESSDAVSSDGGHSGGTERDLHQGHVGGGG